MPELVLYGMRLLAQQLLGTVLDICSGEDCVKVCTPTGMPDCRGPCYNCEDYCEPVQQTWCELQHSISTRTEVRTACQPGGDNGQ